MREEFNSFQMIYCIEDDSTVRDLMVYTLRASGFEAMGFENDTGFWAAMKEQRPEMRLRSGDVYPDKASCGR